MIQGLCFVPPFLEVVQGFLYLLFLVELGLRAPIHPAQKVTDFAASRPSSVEPSGAASPMEMYSDQLHSSSEFPGSEEGISLYSPVPVMMPSNYDNSDQTMLHPYYQNIYPQHVQPYHTTPETTLPGSIYHSSVQSYIDFALPQYQSTAWTQPSQMVLPVTSAQYGYAPPFATTTNPEILPRRLYKTGDL